MSGLTKFLLGILWGICFIVNPVMCLFYSFIIYVVNKLYNIHINNLINRFRKENDGRYSSK